MKEFETSVIPLSSLIQTLKDDLIEKNQLIRIEQVSQITTLAKSSIRLWVAQSKFPPPIRLSPTINVWRLQDVMCWINSKQGEQD